MDPTTCIAFLTSTLHSFNVRSNNVEYRSCESFGGIFWPKRDTILPVPDSKNGKDPAPCTLASYLLGRTCELIIQLCLTARLGNNTRCEKLKKRL